MTIETRADFAKRIGLNRSSVTKMAQAGRLVLTSEGRIEIGPSLERLIATADPARTDLTDKFRAALRAFSGVQMVSGAVEPASDDPAGSDEPEDTPSAAQSFAGSRAIKEHYAAQTARLEYERLSGHLVDTSSVQTAARELGAQLRQALERVPDQLAPELAAEQDQDRVHAVLQAALEDVLRGVADRCQALAARFQAGQ